MPISDLCSRNIVAIEKDSSLQHAARLMKEHHVGGILIVDSAQNPRPLGILTDRDIVLHVIAENKPLSTHVREVMSTHVASISEDAGLVEAVNKMEQEAVRRLVIVDDAGRAIGLISTDDILQLLSQEIYGLGQLVGKQVDRERAKTRFEKTLSV